jgi:hypothetical protein
MKGFRILIVLFCAALLAAGCAVPLGEDYLITRDGAGIIYITNYNLQDYVPIPDKGEQPVTRVGGRGDLDITVTWKDETGADVPQPFETFAPSTVYRAELKISAKEGYVFYSTPFAYPTGKVQTQTDDLGDPVRTVIVTYNNSDFAAFTFITDYNLQSYVPIPLAGEKRPVPDNNTRTDVRVQAAVWQVETPTGSGHYEDMPPAPEPFWLGAVYRADIRLTTKPGYLFIPGRSFAYPDGTLVNPVPESDPNARRFDVIYMPTMSSTKIDEFNLTPYVPKPISGATAALSFAGAQYTGTVNWRNAHTLEVLTGPFQPGASYIAEVILSPAPGYTFTGVGQNVFIHTGAEAVSNPAGNGIITISFSPTGGAGSSMVVYDTILTNRLPKPVNGITPIMGITGPQYAGTVAWIPSHSTFQLGTAYTAVLSLTAAPGFTFMGIGENVFLHGDAPGTVTNSPNSSTVRVAFPAARPPSHAVMSFGPDTDEDSALALLRERSADSNQVLVELPEGSEEVNYNVILLPHNTSPAKVIIDGHGRTLKKTTPGSLFTVPGGVTLTLQNITLQGHPSNNAPLIMVYSGGKLILDSGAVLIGNETTADAGGVWVNGGDLVMNAGVVIKEMSARRGGGVLVNNNGRVIMGGGTIGGPNAGDGNSVSGEDYSGGGVLIDHGFFDMYSGTIQSNSAGADNSGGGVGLVVGTFNQYAGTIRNNKSHGLRSGGGVYICEYYDEAVFTMSGTAVIEDNDALGEAAPIFDPDQSDGSDGSGGGVMNAGGIFIMEAGTIKGNTAHGVRSGGGVYGSFTMYGGSIQGNTAKEANSGGGMYIREEGMLLYGGTIRGNIAEGSASGGGVYNIGHSEMDGAAVVIEGNIAEAADSGGGVYAAVSYFIVRNGIIRGNIAQGPSSAGGVYVDKEGLFYMEGGSMKANTASWFGSSTGNESGGAVYITGESGMYSDCGHFEMTGGVIGGTASGDANTAVVGANGVYIKYGRFELYGGEITGNTGYNNYGVYVAGGPEYEAFIMDSSARVALNNLVFLSPGMAIRVGGLDGTGPVANIICASPVTTYDADDINATKLLIAYGPNTEAKAVIEGVKDRFLYNGSSVNIKIPDTGIPAEWPDFYYYGYYNGQ